MTLLIVRQESSIRFQEVQALFSHLNSIAPTDRDPATLIFNIQKGNFIVLLYGLIEYTTTRAIIEVLTQINSKNVANKHLSKPMHVMALDGHFMSIRDGNNKRKWKSRDELICKMFSRDPVQFNYSCLNRDLSNIWAKTLMEVFQIFGLTASPFYNDTVKSYINEIVERRNAVAHGRESAAEVGQRYSVFDLQKRIEAFDKQRSYMIDQFEAFLMDGRFIDIRFRRFYKK